MNQHPLETKASHNSSTQKILQSTCLLQGASKAKYIKADIEEITAIRSWMLKHTKVDPMKKSTPPSLYIPYLKAEEKLTHPHAALLKLRWAIKNKDMPTIRTLIQAGIDINIKSEAFVHPIFTAIRLENCEIFNYIFSNTQLDLTIRNWEKQNIAEAIALRAPWPRRQKALMLRKIAERGLSLPIILHAACVDDKDTVSKELELKKPATTDNRNATPMMYACANGHKAIVTLLFNHDHCCLETSDDFDASPVLIAAAAGQISTLELLKSLGANMEKRDSDNTTIFLTAVENGQLKMVQHLFSQKRLKERNHVGLTPLLLATTEDHLEVARFLVEMGANPKEDRDDAGNNLLLAAMIDGSHRIIRWALKNNFATLQDKNESGMNLTLAAAANGYVEVVSWLHKEKGMSLRIKNAALIIHAAGHGHIPMVEWLLKHGATLEDKNEHGATALYAAVETDQEEMVVYLLDLLKEDKNLLKSRCTYGYNQAMFLAKDKPNIFKHFETFDATLTQRRLAEKSDKPSTSPVKTSTSSTTTVAERKTTLPPNVGDILFLTSSTPFTQNTREITTQLFEELNALERLLAGAQINPKLRKAAENSLTYYRASSTPPKNSDVNLVRKLKESLTPITAPTATPTGPSNS